VLGEKERVEHTAGLDEYEQRAGRNGSLLRLTDRSDAFEAVEADENENEADQRPSTGPQFLKGPCSAWNEQGLARV